MVSSSAAASPANFDNLAAVIQAKQDIVPIKHCDCDRYLSLQYDPELWIRLAFCGQKAMYEATDTTASFTLKGKSFEQAIPPQPSPQAAEEPRRAEFQGQLLHYSGMVVPPDPGAKSSCCNTPAALHWSCPRRPCSLDI